MSTTSDGEHSYPSWLPKRPPPPAPASTYNSTTGFDTHGRPRVLDIFPSARMTGSPSAPTSAHIQGRKPTPRSVRIVAKDAEQWRVDGAGSRSRLREQTGDSAETRVIHQHSNQVSGRHHMGHPSMIARHPGPINNPRNWNLATAAYLACYFLQILIPRPSVLPTSPPGSGSLHSHPPTNPQTHARSQSLSSTTTTSSTDTSSTGFLNLFVSFTPFIAESAYFFSQNTPTVVLLLPRAALCLALLLQSPAGADLGRDSTYFDANGALTSYARGILFANAIWTLWRSIVLLGSFTTLWILSGSACAGICGPRYRWEEYPDPESEVEVDENDDWAFVNLNPWLRAHPRNRKRSRRRDMSDLVVHDREPETQENRDREHASTTSSFFSPVSSAPIPSEVGVESGIERDRKPSPHASPRIQLASPVHSRPVTRTMTYPNDTHYPTPPVRAYMAEDPPLSDSWNWKRGTRRRIREAWEFCLTNTGGKWLGSSSGGPVDAVGKKDEGGVDDSPRTRAIIQQRTTTAPSDLEGSGEHDISLDSEDFKGLDEVLRQSVLHRNVLRSRPKLSPSAVGLSDIIPPPEGPLPSSSDSTTQVHSNIVSPPVPDQAYGSQRSRRSDPLRVLPFPIQVGPIVGSGGMGTPGTAPATATTTTLSSYPPSAFATAPIGMAPTVSTPPIPATPTTATTLIMTGIPFPSPTRSRSRTRLQTQESEEGISRIIRGEGEEQEIEEEEREHEEEEEEVEEVEEEGETEDYDDDFIDDDEEGEGYEEDYGDDYENIDEFEREADIEEYDEDYDLSGSPRGAEEQGDPEEQDVTYDEFGAPIPRRRRRTSASLRSGTVSGSGSASMSSLGKPINETSTNIYGVYAFSTVGSATMSSASRSAGRSGTHSTSHGGSRMGTVSSRGSRGTRASFSPASASVSASRSGATGSVSATGTRSSRGSTRANRGDPTVSRVAVGRVRQRGRGRRNGEGKIIDNDGIGKGREEKIVTASPAVSASAQSQKTSLSVSPHSRIQSLSPQTIPSISASLSPASASSPHAASSPSAGRSPNSPNRDDELKLPQHSSNPQSLSPPTLPPPPTAVHAQGSGARRERTRPRRERGREYTDHLHAPSPASPSALRARGSARTRTDSATLPPQLHAEPIPPPGEGDTSLDIEFPVPLGVYSPAGGRSSRSRRTETGETARRRTRTMSSGFSGRGAELVLPQPMPEGYEEDEGDGSQEVEQGMSYLGSGAAFPLTEMRETSVERNSLNDPTRLNGHSENEDILGLLSPTHPTSNPDVVPSSAPGSRAASTSTSPHTRSPRSSLKSLSSRPSLASLAANLGANLTTGVRHLGTSSQRVGFTGTPSRGSRSTSRENRFIQPGSGGTPPPPPPPPSQPSIRSRAQSLIQSIRNRSSSFVELVEMHEDGGDDGDIRSVEGSPMHSGVEGDDEDITMALTSTSPTQRDTRSLMQSNEDEDELRLSSPSHSSGSPSSNPNSTAHTPSSNSHSPPTRIIGVPRGIEFGSSRRESSGTASSSSPSGGRSSGEGRRPLSMLSTSGLAAPGAGSEGTFGRPGELAGFVRRERELAIDRGEVTDVDGQRRTSLPSGLVHGYLPTIPSMDMMSTSRSQTDLNSTPQGGDAGIVPTGESRIVEESSTASGTRTEPVSIPTTRQEPDSSSSPSGISTAPASFITATPSISFTHTSTTESVRGRGSGTEQGSDNTSAGNGSGSSGRGANTSIDPLWRDQTRRGTGGPVAGGWHLGPA
ncbi:hypothetical protein Clacol_008409 [Clathrus columnatus]|uniref:Uncharacterized protein n=1 Tax=Clathrus columnatus TaxID=1419009 RepID=A0AAV5ALZ8_9AGAM|nr:hypothetical protein Clacol_008409 [Clathrus columnatus]